MPSFLLALRMLASAPTLELLETALAYFPKHIALRISREAEARDDGQKDLRCCVVL